MLNAALGSMPYGFSVWSEDHRLVLWNQRYLEIYDLPAELVRRGMTLRDVCEVTVAAGNYPGKTVDEVLRIFEGWLAAQTDPRQPSVHEKRLGDRIITLHLSPRPRTRLGRQPRGHLGSAPQHADAGRPRIATRAAEPALRRRRQHHAARAVHVRSRHATGDLQRPVCPPLPPSARTAGAGHAAEDASRASRRERNLPRRPARKLRSPNGWPSLRPASPTSISCR